MPTASELVSVWRNQGPVAWAQGPYGWIGEDGQPVTLAPWQVAALNAWWANRETCSTLAISNIKKSGKTACNAFLLAWRWLALPGQHFAVGNDLDQSQARQFSEIAEMVKRHPYLSTVCSVNRNEITFSLTGSKLTALAVDAAGNAGANHLTASHTEAWGIIYEAGIRAYEELTPPPGKKWGLPALRICDSYAGFEGESKTWHGLVDRGLSGERIGGKWPIFKVGGLILFHAEGEEARVTCYRGTQAEAKAYYAEQQVSLRLNAFIRMHGNQRTSGEGAFVTPEAWRECRSGDVHPLQPGQVRRIVFGADASTSRDFTALVGCEHTGKNFVDVVYTHVWKPVRGQYRGGRPTVDLDLTLGAEVLRLKKAGQIAAILCDPFQLHTSVLAWQRAGIRVIELAQNAGRVESDQALYDAIISQTLRHYGDPVLSEHVINAVAQETPRGFRLAKEKAVLKIDAAVALSMAHYGCLKPGIWVKYDVF